MLPSGSGTPGNFGAVNSYRDVWVCVRGQEDRGGEAGSCPVRVTLSNGHVHDVDCVICGIGVEPDTDWLPAQLERSPADGGVLVDLYAPLWPPITPCPIPLSLQRLSMPLIPV